MPVLPARVNTSRLAQIRGNDPQLLQEGKTIGLDLTLNDLSILKFIEAHGRDNDMFICGRDVLEWTCLGTLKCLFEKHFVFTGHQYLHFPMRIGKGGKQVFDRLLKPRQTLTAPLSMIIDGDQCIELVELPIVQDVVIEVYDRIACGGHMFIVFWLGERIVHGLSPGHYPKEECPGYQEGRFERWFHFFDRCLRKCRQRLTAEIVKNH